jgi:hypothetical protein
MKRMETNVNVHLNNGALLCWAEADMFSDRGVLWITAEGRVLRIPFTSILYWSHDDPKA